MSQEITIDEIFDLRDGASIPSVHGRITKVMRRSEGKNKVGPWSFENFIMNDGGRDDIKVSLKNMPPLDNQFREGVDVVIENAIAIDEDYEGKTERKIRLEWDQKERKQLGDLFVAKGNGSRGNAPTNQRNSPPPAPRNDPPAPRNDRQPSAPNPNGATEDELEKSKRRIGCVATMMLISHEWAKMVRKEIESGDGKPMSEDDFRGIRSSIFIQAGYDKCQWGFPPLHTYLADKKKSASKAPLKPEPPKQPPPPEPAEPVEDDVPF